MKNKIIYFLSVVASTLFSLFVYAHIAETIFLVDIPYINGVTSTKIPDLILQSDTLAKNEDVSRNCGIYGLPTSLSLRRLGLSTDLQASRPHRRGWILLQNTTTYLYTSQSKGGKMGNIVVMSQSDNRSLSAARLAVIGDRIDIQTDKNWRYNYRVVKKTTIDSDSKYLPDLSSNTKLFVVIPSTKDGHSTYFVLETEFLSLEEIT